MSIHIREATPADGPAIVALVPRLRAFGTVPLRPIDAHDRAEREALEEALAKPKADAVVYAAELDEMGLVGVAYAQTATDYFTREIHGYLAILAVSKEAEGRGVGRALITATEDWARRRGYRILTLNVFAANLHAQAVYERAGFTPDVIRYAKQIQTAPPTTD